MDKLIVFKATGEVRPPKKGEYYSNRHEIKEAHNDFFAELPIYTRHEIDATPEILKMLEGN
jgi:hypothetical protein